MAGRHVVGADDEKFIRAGATNYSAIEAAAERRPLAAANRPEMLLFHQLAA